mgnify:CR=1 FL=1
MGFALLQINTSQNFMERIRLLYQDQDKLMSYFLDLLQQLTTTLTTRCIYFGLQVLQLITFVMAHLLGHSPHENINYRATNNY